MLKLNLYVTLLLLHFMQLLHKSQYAVIAYCKIALVIGMFVRIRELREDNDVTQSQIAKIIKVSQSTYSRYESGFLDVPSEVLIALSKYYKVSVDYILGLSDK